MKMGPKVYYAPEGAPAGTTDGSVGREGQPESTNATTAALKPWMAQLPGDLKTNEYLSQFPTQGAAIKALMEAKDAVKQPEPEKKEEAAAEPVKYENFGAKLATEDDPLGYIGNGLADYLQGKNIQQKDAEDLVNAFSGVLSSAKTEMLKKGRELCEDAIRAEWGKDYDTKRAFVARGVQAVDPDGTLQAKMDSSGVSLMPVFWEFCSKVGQLVAEDRGTPYSAPGKKQGGVPIDYSKPSV